MFFCFSLVVVDANNFLRINHIQKSNNRLQIFSLEKHTHQAAFAIYLPGSIENYNVGSHFRANIIIVITQVVVDNVVIVVVEMKHWNIANKQTEWQQQQQIHNQTLNPCRIGHTFWPRNFHFCFCCTQFSSAKTETILLITSSTPNTDKNHKQTNCNKNT